MTAAGSGEALRQQLAAAAQTLARGWEGRPDPEKVTMTVVNAIWPLVEAALAAQAEELAQAIEHDPSNGWVQMFTDCGSHSRQRSPKEWADFVRSRGSVPAPKGDQ